MYIQAKTKIYHCCNKNTAKGGSLQGMEKSRKTLPRESGERLSTYDWINGIGDSLSR